MNILLVEDDVVTRTMLAKRLRILGYIVIEAANGEEGLVKYASNTVDMVLADLMMPIMDGKTMIHQIKDINPKQRFIILTAGDHEDHCASCPIVTKPIKIKELVELL